MARSDLIIDLIKAGVAGDSERLRRVATAMAEDERAKKRSGVAERIDKALKANGRTANGASARPPLALSTPGLDTSIPRRGIDELFLDPTVRSGCDQVIEEQRGASLLRSHGVEPRHRLLLTGPPGNGKTSLAEAIAYELSIPIHAVRYDAVVTSYLGETAGRLRKLFDAVQSEPCVLFFDEFDTIGKERGDLHETGEIKRVVSTLLLQLDAVPSYCVLVAATNHPELLDRAAWRRFELNLDISRPDEKVFEAYFARAFQSFGESVGVSPRTLTKKVRFESLADAEAFVLHLRRRWILSTGAQTLRQTARRCVDDWIARPGRYTSATNERSTDPETSRPDPPS